MDERDEIERDAEGMREDERKEAEMIEKELDAFFKKITTYKEITK